MSHFAEVDAENIVQRVIVISQENINSGNWGNPSSWIQTSYNTHGGKHYDQEGVEDSGVALRYNYAGEGYTYDTTRDAFIAPKPYPSWTLVEATCQWEAPVARPDDDKRYTWDEDVINWVEVP
jgi:hypothetical protein|tara:strand:- start:2411 stop:2779 length:369 start_codon:yes stop_codon:yes gene_type:complete